MIPRPELVEALVGDESRVVIVGGVSGAGKSVVLQQAVVAVHEERYVAGIHEVTWSDPLLTMLIDRLSEVVAEVIDETGAIARIGERLSGAIERMARTGGRELAHAAGQELLSFVRGRLGPEAGKALAEAVKALQEESGQALGARLERARSQTQRELIVGFFTEVVALCDGRPVLVALDRCERLDDKGLRLLADLAEMLPEGCQIWAAAKTDASSGQFLSTTDASVVEVPALDRESVGELLEQQGLPVADAEEVLARTAGTALDVHAYVGLLESGGPVPEEDRDEVLVRDTARRWEQLSQDIRGFVLRLATLSDPLPERYMTLLADGDASLRGRAIDELRAVGLLTAHGGGDWFHERRGAALLAAAEPEERAVAFADAATAVWAYVREGAPERWLVELAELAGHAEEGWALADEDVRAVLTLDAGGLAIVAGLFELEEKGQPLDALQLLTYIRATYPTEGRELDRLQEVSEKGIAVLVTAPRHALVTLNASPVAQAVAYGRIARTFGQLPLRRIATLAFEHVLAPRLRPFSIGEHGVGFPSLEALSKIALGATEEYGITQAARREAGPALIVRGDFADRSLYGAFRFDDERQRDRALDAVSQLDVEFLDSKVAISTAVAYPIGVVPANRFMRAASRVIGRKVKPRMRRAQGGVDPPLSFDEFADLVVRTRQILRVLSGATMRGAMGLDRPLSMHWVVDDSSALIAEVSGGREIACRHEGESLVDIVRDDSPFLVFQLEKEMDLRPEESIINVREHYFADPEYGPMGDDPVLAEIERRQSAATAYNQAQPPLGVRLDDSLVDLVRESFLRELVDARALAAALPFLGRDDWEVPATTRYVVLERPTVDDEGFFVDLDARIMWAEGPSLSGKDECHVVFRQHGGDVVGGRAFRINTETLKLLPPLDLDEIERSAWRRGPGGIAEMLGHAEGDIDLLPPQADD